MDKLPDKNQQQEPAPSRKFSFYWIYLILFGGLMLFYVLNRPATVKEITWQQFEKDIIGRKAVERIDVVNNETA